MDVIIDRAWLVTVENQVNAVVNDIKAKANEARNMLGVGNLKQPLYNLDYLDNLGKMPPKKLLKLPCIDNIVASGELPENLQVPDVEFELPNGEIILITLFMGYCEPYKTAGMLITASQYIKFAEECNYRICIEAGAGYYDITSLLTVWYINDLKKLKGKAIQAPPLMVGSRNYGEHFVSIGIGSDCGLNLHGTDKRYGTEIIQLNGGDCYKPLPFFEL